MYAKLFASILDSSVWLESMPTRIVWLTLLAAKDQEGFARFASIENLARRAVVTSADAEKAVARLEAPDPKSSNPDHEGRRIERVPGGWVILNAKLYDDMVRREDERRANRERVRRHRAKEPAAVPQRPSVPSVAEHGERFPDADQRAAYLALRASASRAETFDAMLRAVVVPPSGGMAYAWDVVGRALHDLHANGTAQVTAATMRAFCRRIVNDDSRSVGQMGKAGTKQERGRDALAETLRRRGFANGDAPDHHAVPRALPRTLPDAGRDLTDG